MSKKIMLVLRDRTDKLLLRNSLEGHGYEVFEPGFVGPVSDMSDIIDIARLDFDVLVTELATGGISGPDILYALQGILNSSRTAVLWSGSVRTIEPPELLFAGMPREYFGEKLRFIKTLNDTSLESVVDAVVKRLR